MAKQILHNRCSKDQLIKRLDSEQFNRKVISFYRYAHLNDPVTLRNQLYLRWSQLGLLGRIYLAHEGINAQVSVPEPQLNSFRVSLEMINFLKGIPLNQALVHHKYSFLKLIIKVRPKLVADGLAHDAIDVTNKGKHISAEAFNALAGQPETLVVDMRNRYESEIGHMENAICPQANSFREELSMVAQMLAPYKDRPLLMYCTGGIRCEKASAYMKHCGFEQVYQLEGGIIAYARQCEEKGLPNKFIGKNFVFDERMAEPVGGQVISTCHQCSRPSDRQVNCANDLCHNLFIQCMECNLTMEGSCSPHCKQMVNIPKADRKATHETFVSSRSLNNRHCQRPTHCLKTT